MKWLFTLVVFGAASVVSGASVEKRASTSDVATIGYATTSGGTTGGKGGTTTTVTTLAALTSAVAGNTAKIVIISGTITGDTVVQIGSNTSVLGKSGAKLTGVGLRVLSQSNVIIRNLIISKVLASAGDAIGIQEAHNVWVDHVDLSSDLDHDKDYYDGLLDITHGCYAVTVTNSYLHDHWKASLVGHSDNNGDEDAALQVTYANNYWQNLSSRTPSFRFGHGHIYNNVFDSNSDGINTRDGAQLLIQNNVWSSPKKPLYSTDEGYAVASGNDFGGGSNTAPAGTFTSPPYTAYSLIAVGSVRAAVVGTAGATLSF